MLVHCATPFTGMGVFDAKPYPTLPKPFTDLLAETPSQYPQRTYCFAPEWVYPKHFLFALPKYFPTVYRIFSFSGYYDNTFIVTPENAFAREKMRTDTMAAFRAYGVRWVSRYRNWPDNFPEFAAVRRAARHRVTLPDIDVWEIENAAPLAFSAAQPTRPLPITVDGRGVKVDVVGVPAGTVVVNFLKRPWMVAYADGKSIPTQADAWQRVAMTLPAGTATLEVVYQPPWHRGFCAGLIALLAAIVRLDNTCASHSKNDADSVIMPVGDVRMTGAGGKT